MVEQAVPSVHRDPKRQSKAPLRRNPDPPGSRCSNAIPLSLAPEEPAVFPRNQAAIS